MAHIPACVLQLLSEEGLRIRLGGGCLWNMDDSSICDLLCIDQPDSK